MRCKQLARCGKHFGVHYSGGQEVAEKQKMKQNCSTTMPLLFSRPPTSSHITPAASKRAPSRFARRAAALLRLRNASR